jgi:UDP-N-acetyl-D-galactosamine dehydrogenase
MNDKVEKEVIGVIGLGYVGLPLACMFARQYRVVGYDLSEERVAGINRGQDVTAEVDGEALLEAIHGGLTCTTDSQALRGCNFYIVAVPTPTDTAGRGQPLGG